MVASSSTATTSKTSSSKSKIPSLLAGISGGATSTVLLYPLDLIKVRLQVNEGEVQHKHNNNNTKTTQQSWQRQRQNRMTFVRTFRGLIKHEGISGIYQGLTPALVGSAASWGGYFFLYDTMKSEWTTYKTHQENQNQNPNKTATKVTMSPLENFGAACLSGAIMVFFTNPVWLIKTRMQLQMKSVQTTLSEDQNQKIKMKKPYTSMADAAKTIVKEEGFQGLYKGTVPALMLVSHGGVQFVVYEFLKERFHVTVENHRRNMDVSTEYASVSERFQKSIGYLSMGAISKVIATTVTYPVQVVKARIQQRSESIELTTSGEVKIVHRKYTGVRDVITKVWQREGILGFFKGCIPNAIRVAPGAAITFVTYETVMDILKS